MHGSLADPTTAYLFGGSRILTGHYWSRQIQKGATNRYVSEYAKSRFMLIID
jgi:hypothetical protein